MKEIFCNPVSALAPASNGTRDGDELLLAEFPFLDATEGVVEGLTFVIAGLFAVGDVVVVSGGVVSVGTGIAGALIAALIRATSIPGGETPAGRDGEGTEEEGSVATAGEI